MPKRPEQNDEQPNSNGQASTPGLDRLEKLANVAATAAQEKQWRARKSGLREQEEPAEVRNLSDDPDARAKAEEAMRKLMANPKGKQRGR
jgi:hypothetical protein